MQRIKLGIYKNMLKMKRQNDIDCENLWLNIDKGEWEADPIENLQMCVFWNSLNAWISKIKW